MAARIWCVVMRYPSDRPLSLQEWLVLCLVGDQPTYGFAVAGLLSPEGSLGRVAGDGAGPDDRQAAVGDARPGSRAASKMRNGCALRRAVIPPWPS
jgi:hypothetical protein